MKQKADNTTFIVVDFYVSFKVLRVKELSEQINDINVSHFWLLIEPLAKYNQHWYKASSWKKRSKLLR